MSSLHHLKTKHLREIVGAFFCFYDVNFTSVFSNANEAVSESNLEDALLDNLHGFLMELGHGFCLEARQKSIVTQDSADKMALHEVPTLVNNPKFDSPACITRI